MMDDDFLKIINKYYDNKNKKEKFYNCCDNQNIIEIDKSLICNNCGVVLEYLMDYNLETYDTNSRCKQKIDQNLPNTNIYLNNYEYKYNNLNKWNYIPYKERSLKRELEIIENNCKKINLDKNIIDDAKFVYKIFFNSNKDTKKLITRGNVRKSINISVIYVTCFRNKLSFTLKDFSRIYNIKERKLIKGYKILFNVIKEYKLFSNVKYSNIYLFVEKFCLKLNINTIDTKIIIKISKNISRLNILTNHSPLSLIASSILLGLEYNNNVNITIKDISKCLDVSESTIFRIYKKMKKINNILVSNKLTEKILKSNNKIKNDFVLNKVILKYMKKFKFYLIFIYFNSVLEELKYITYLFKNNKIKEFIIYYNNKFKFTLNILKELFKL